MENRASAIIISKRHILLIHRIRAQREYYVFPGGHIEDGETPADACIREVLEETGLRVAWLEPAFDYPNEKNLAHYFFVETHPGTLSFSGGPETLKRSETNRYLLEWIPLVRIGEVNLQPAAVQSALARVVAEDGPIREAQDLARLRERLAQILGEPGAAARL